MGDLYGIVRLGLDAGRQRLEAIGLNTANAARPGYRRMFALESAMAAGETAPMRASAADRPPSTLTAPSFPFRPATGSTCARARCSRPAARSTWRSKATDCSSR